MPALDFVLSKLLSGNLPSTPPLPCYDTWGHGPPPTLHLREHAQVVRRPTNPPWRYDHVPSDRGFTQPGGTRSIGPIGGPALAGFTTLPPHLGWELRTTPYGHLTYHPTKRAQHHRLRSLPLFPRASKVISRTLARAYQQLLYHQPDLTDQGQLWISLWTSAQLVVLGPQLLLSSTVHVTQYHPFLTLLCMSYVRGRIQYGCGCLVTCLVYCHPSKYESYGHIYLCERDIAIIEATLNDAFSNGTLYGMLMQSCISEHNWSQVWIFVIMFWGYSTCHKCLMHDCVKKVFVSDNLLQPISFESQYYRGIVRLEKK